MPSAEREEPEPPALSSLMHPHAARPSPEDLEVKKLQAEVALLKKEMAKRPKPEHWETGTKARLVDLKNAIMLNGQIATVRSYDNSTKRYIVQVPDGSLKRIKPSNLAAVDPEEVNEATAVAQQPLLTVCNAYPDHMPLQAFEISADESGYNQVVKNLEFQMCLDITRLHHKTKWISFVVGRLQVARIEANATEWSNGHGLQLVVQRDNVNSLKARVRQTPLEKPDEHAYYLHVINAYAGEKSQSLQLHVERGSYNKAIAFDSTFRLTREEPITLTLMDGSDKLQLGFEPRKTKSYCIVATGADMGLKGEPQNPGLIAHEVGTWTSFEKMAGDESAGQGESAPPLLPLGEAPKEEKPSASPEDMTSPHHSSYFGIAALLTVAFMSFFLYGYMDHISKNYKLPMDRGNSTFEDLCEPHIVENVDHAPAQQVA